MKDYNHQSCKIDWEIMYPRLAASLHITDVILEEDIPRYQDDFFQYVEDRDDARALKLLNSDDVQATMINDPHAAKMRLFVSTELDVLNRLNAQQTCKGIFVHIGCGGMAETLMHASGSDVFEQYYGIDNREVAVDNANRIFQALNIADKCEVVFNEASIIPKRKPKTVMLAAYLHPDRQTVFDLVCQQTGAGDIIVVRNVLGGLGAFSTPVDWEGKAEEMSVSAFPALGVETRYLRRLP